MRLFLSLPIEKHFLRVFTRYADAMSDVRYLRWVPERKLHITLMFLGELGEEHSEVLTAALTRACATHKPFSLELAKVAYAPPGKTSAMVWAYWRIAPELNTLRVHVGEVCRACGLTPEDQYVAEADHVPHITLARFRSDTRVRELRELPRTELEGHHMLIEGVELLESKQTKIGSGYRRVALLTHGGGDTDSVPDQLSP